MTKLRIERTNFRSRQHVWYGLAYVGMVIDKQVIILPHLEAVAPRIKEMMHRYAEFEFVIGTPAEDDLGELIERAPAKKAAPKKKTATQPKGK